MLCLLTEAFSMKLSVPPTKTANRGINVSSCPKLEIAHLAYSGFRYGMARMAKNEDSVVIVAVTVFLTVLKDCVGTWVHGPERAGAWYRRRLASVIPLPFSSKFKVLKNG